MYTFTCIPTLHIQNTGEPGRRLYLTDGDYYIKYSWQS